MFYIHQCWQVNPLPQALSIPTLLTAPSVLNDRGLDAVLGDDSWDVTVGDIVCNSEDEPRLPDAAICAIIPTFSYIDASVDCHVPRDGADKEGGNLF
jgi:hypothetical protein